MRENVRSTSGWSLNYQNRKVNKVSENLLNFRSLSFLWCIGVLFFFLFLLCFYCLFVCLFVLPKNTQEFWKCWILGKNVVRLPILNVEKSRDFLDYWAKYLICCWLYLNNPSKYIAVVFVDVFVRAIWLVLGQTLNNQCCAQAMWSYQ